MVLGTGLWSLGYLLGFFNTDLEWKLIMMRIEMFGAICSAYFWFIFAVSYTQYEFKLTKQRMLLLAVFPIITFIEILTIKYHSFYYKSYHVGQEGNLIRFFKEYNFGFYIWAMYAYILDISGALVFIWGILHKPKLYLRQIIPITVAAVMLIIPNILYVTNNNPISPYDPTPLSFLVIGVIMVFLLKRYQLFEIVPIALHSVFRNVKSGVIIIDTNGRILELNPKAEEIIGKTQNAVLGCPLPEVFPEYEKLTKEQNSTPKLSAEIEIGYSKRIFELQINPIFNDENNMMGSVVMLYDITQRKHALKELDAFARTVAHDLKTPLAIQSSLTELLTSEDLSSEEKSEILVEVSQGANKMINIIDALLLLASVRNKDDIKIQPLNMDEIIDHALSRLNIGSQATDIQVIRSKTMPVVPGYAPWVEEIWVNYISNAIKYGGTPPIVEIGSDKYQSHVRFWVKDNGKGLTNEEQEDIFKEFTRLKRHMSEKTGHGLGLAIVLRIVEKLGGKVGVESDGKNGCKFYFTLREK
ncbi:MAG: hypothetical protein A2W90_07650 [Bacteroidetes bacterium GWF2_42_66]|nr:MAG: hypothetical protein A2W92_09565 [Bacteroidetes bacterium GWA2_42_15]OFX96596.1 MAG: hypothetical protein A2W89_13550 [Bacteroidetes bacterium GWE2_42_39]OFY45321.1 MAG: hypothetical protein A2W90_07650 [Bacteroidetes bacterium GWF2_42_66]